MTPFFILLYIMYFASTGGQEENENVVSHPLCDGRQSNYNISNILGSWHVVGLIPEPEFPRLRKIACYMMDITETDEAGLRWLVSRKFRSPSQEFINRIKGAIIRQRYHSDRPFDIWSKAVPGMNGCFKQLFSLETNNTRLADAENLGTTMQLHTVEPDDESGPYLVQVLWGRLISSVIYRRTEGISFENMDTIHEFVRKIKGYQRQPRICERPSREVVPPAFQRP